MEIKKNITPTCFYCNTEMRIDLDGMMVVNIGGYRAENKEEKENKTNVNPDEMIETVSAKLCTCPLCGRKERVIGEDPMWFSFIETTQLIKNGKIVSQSPEIELILKYIAKFI